MSQGTSRRTVGLAIGAASIGNFVEWFDYVSYSHVAVTIAADFFPARNPTAGLISTFAVLALASFVRPLGSLIFGPLGDRIGRRRVLAITITLMSVCTFAIGLLPTYQQIGIVAPVLLVLARLGQGLGTGGEYTSAATYIAEYAPRDRRGLLSSMLSVGTRLGFLASAGLITLLSATLSASQFSSWGWRVPFLVALPLGIVGLYLRTRLEESPAFNSIAERGALAESPMYEAFRHSWRRMVLLILALVVLQVGSYTVLTYMPTYLTSSLHVAGPTALATTDVLIASALVLIPLAGWLSDRIGRKPVLLAGCVGFIACSVPSFSLIGHRTVPTLIAGMLMLGICLDLLLGVSPALIVELFPTRLRSGAAAISYNLSVAIFGGLTPVVLTALVSATTDRFVPAYYLVASALISVVPVLLLPETARTLIIDQAPRSV